MARNPLKHLGTPGEKNDPLYLTVGKKNVWQGGAGLFEHIPESWGLERAEGGAILVSPARIGATHLAAIPARCLARRPSRESNPNWPQGPRPANPHSDPALPKWNWHKACDPEPGSRELLADAASPHFGTGVHWLHRGPRRQGLSGSAPQTLLRLQPLPCLGLLGDQLSQLFRLPDPDTVRGNRAVRSWAIRFTSSCLGFFICKRGIITDQPSYNCWEY